jgi:hypothetical protein
MTRVNDLVFLVLPGIQHVVALGAENDADVGRPVVLDVVVAGAGIRWLPIHCGRRILKGISGRKVAGKRECLDHECNAAGEVCGTFKSLRHKQLGNENGVV